MKILHITAGMDFGGIAEVVASLSSQQAALGYDITIATVASQEEKLVLALEDFFAGGGQIVRFAPSFPRPLFFSWQMFFGLKALVKKADVVHVHSSWTFPVWCGCHFALKYRKPLVMTSHGCFAPERLKISTYKKRIVGWLSDRRFLKRASVIQATCKREAEDIRAYLGSSKVRKCGSAEVGKADVLTTNELMNSHTNELPLDELPPIVVIPNGVDLASFNAVTADREFVDAKWPVCKGKCVALFLSRIHPIKGLEDLIEAWCGGDEWLLVIAGSGDKKYIQKLSQQVEEAGLSDSIKFIGPVFGDVKIKLMKAAEFFVLPTKNENFGIVVAEALACGTPVITTKGAPWSELLGNSDSEQFTEKSSLITHNSSFAANGCAGWWIDHGVEPLAEALKEAMALTDAERKSMGENGRKLIETKYQWRAIATQMQEVYKQTKTSV